MHGTAPKRLGIMFFLLAVLSGEVFASGVTVRLNKASFAPGDLMEVSVGVQASEIPAAEADLYLVLGTPDGHLYSVLADGSLGEADSISPALREWAVTTVPETRVVGVTLPAVVSPGTYTWYLALCPPGSDPVASGMWLGSDAASAVVGEFEVVQSRMQRESDPEVSADHLTALVAGNTRFALGLYKELASAEGNLFFSPYSISLALAMTYAGARGETATQMAGTLGFTLAQGDMHRAFNALDQALATRGQGASGQDGEGFRLNIANSIWGQRGYPFLPDFLDTLAGNYGAGLRLLDFESAPEAGRITINEWVSAETEGKIQDLIPEGTINAATRLVLTNAIYFNAAWQYPFDRADTKDGAFRLPGDGEVSVPMMSGTEMLPYCAGDGYQAVEIPYDGGELSMLVLLPEAGRFGEIETSLTPEMLETVILGLQVQNVRLAMPRFDFLSPVGLKDVLAAMGMTDAFVPGLADFSGMDGSRDLFVMDCIHKAFVAVDEAGTEAAAATAVIVGLTALPTPPVEFSADRPFLFLIRDRATGTVLFMGRVLDPSGP